MQCVCKTPPRKGEVARSDGGVTNIKQSIRRLFLELVTPPPFQGTSPFRGGVPIQALGIFTLSAWRSNAKRLAYFFQALNLHIKYVRIRFDV